MWLDKDFLDRRLDNPLTYVNCAGYAFGVNGWYEFGDSEDEAYWKFMPHLKSKGEPWKDWERRCVRRILRDFPGWKLIDRKIIDNLEIDPEEYQIVAMRLRRCYVFSDFHFMRCEENGDWTEKHGSDPEIHRRRYEQIYDAWDGGYNGKIYFFAKPRAEKKNTQKKVTLQKKPRGMSNVTFSTASNAEWHELKTEHVPFYRNVKTGS